MDYLPNWTVYVGVVGVALSPKKNILVNTYRCADTKIGLLLLVRRDLGVRTDDSDRNGSGHVLNKERWVDGRACVCVWVCACVCACV